MVQQNTAEKFCITFAGAVGSSKSPISNYLSYNLNLPVFSNDSIRSEVSEDLKEFNQDEFKNRKNARLNAIFQSGISFILDASIDRQWGESLSKISESGYKFFVISIDISKELLTNLYKSKGYLESLKRLDQLWEDHQNFIKEYKDVVNLSITDETFPSRLELSLNAAKKWMSSLATKN